MAPVDIARIDLKRVADLPEREIVTSVPQGPTSVPVFLERRAKGCDRLFQMRFSRSPSLQSVLPRLFWVIAQSSGI
jgi:hypothetical protein